MVCGTGVDDYRDNMCSSRPLAVLLFTQVDNQVDKMVDNQVDNQVDNAAHSRRN